MILVLAAAALAFIFLYFRGKSLALTTDSYSFQKESAAPLTSEPHHTGFDGGTEANKAGQSSGGNQRSRLPQFFFNPVNQAVDHAGIAVHNSASHTVNGIFSDDLFGNIQADRGKLGGFAA